MIAITVNIEEVQPGVMSVDYHIDPTSQTQNETTIAQMALEHVNKGLDTIRAAMSNHGAIHEVKGEGDGSDLAKDTIDQMKQGLKDGTLELPDQDQPNHRRN